MKKRICAISWSITKIHMFSLEMLVVGEKLNIATIATN
jgi:hypothetical protein